MNSAQFAQLLESTYKNMIDLSSTKGEEYAGSEDRLANFKRLGGTLNLIPEAVLMVYFTKHLDSITTFIKDIGALKPRQLSEPIEGRIDDAILYLILLKGLIQERVGIPEKVDAIIDPRQLSMRLDEQLPDKGRT